MRKKHPQWTDRQIKCLLYWQPKARKQLKERILVFYRQFKGYRVTTVPEAMGVDVIKTLGQVGIDIDWTLDKVALAGVPLNRRKG